MFGTYANVISRSRPKSLAGIVSSTRRPKEMIIHMVRRFNFPLILCIAGWILVASEEASAMVYHEEPLLSFRLLLLVVAVLVSLNVWAALRSGQAQRGVDEHRVAVPVASSPRGSDGEPTTAELAFGLGRDLERQRAAAANGTHLRSISHR